QPIPLLAKIGRSFSSSLLPRNRILTRSTTASWSSRWGGRAVAIAARRGSGRIVLPLLQKASRQEALRQDASLWAKRNDTEQFTGRQYHGLAMPSTRVIAAKAETLRRLLVRSTA